MGKLMKINLPQFSMVLFGRDSAIENLENFIDTQHGKAVYDDALIDNRIIPNKIYVSLYNQKPILNKQHRATIKKLKQAGLLITDIDDYLNLLAVCDLQQFLEMLQITSEEWQQAIPDKCYLKWKKIIDE